MDIKVKKVHPDAILPVYATDGSACFDLYCLEEAVVTCATRAKDCALRTGLSFEIPEGFAMFIYSRSGMALKHDIRLSNCVGVIDSDYRGEVKVMLTNDNLHSSLFAAGSRVAQAVVMPVPKVSFVEVDELSETERGQGGFGSTDQGELFVPISEN